MHVSQFVYSEYMFIGIGVDRGLDQELQIVQDKNARGVVRQHMEALEDTNEILASYRRIQGYLERLTVSD